MTADLSQYRATLKYLTERHPCRYSLVEAICDRHAAAKPHSPALIHEKEDGSEVVYSFATLRELSIRFANALTAQGIGRGDRVALLLGHAPEMPIALLACWRIGAIAMPIATLFSGAGLLHRLTHSDAVAVVTDHAGFQSISSVNSSLERDLMIWLIDNQESGTRGFWSDIERASSEASLPELGGDEPAFMIYTSGTTGKAKGALHSHRSWLANVHCMAMIHSDLGVAGDVAWCPAEWTWIAGFSGMLLAFLYGGSPMVAWKLPQPFDPERTFHFMSKRAVRNTLLTPTMLRIMRAVPNPPPLQLRSLFCTGEPLTADMLSYLKETFSLIPGEGYGQTECAPITVHNTAYMPARFGSLGLPASFAQVKVVDADGVEVAPGEVGEIIVHRTHPNVFLRYWRDEALTNQKLRGDWLFTGDEARRDEDGFCWFVGRNDDIIKSSGYRIGPTEIEAALAAHPAVKMVAAIGLPDAIRGEVIAAAIVLRPGFQCGTEIADALIAHGRAALERHEYPRRIEFMEEMPLTVTGKVMRKEIKRILMERSSVQRV